MSGHGPAWANSLFEDNAEHGLGMYLGQKVIRESLAAKLHELAEVTTSESKKAAIEEYFATYDDGKANTPATEKLIAELEADPDCKYSKEILPKKNYLPTPADRLPRPARSVRWRSSPPPARPSARRA